jgi:hypothetical protein
MKVMKIAKTLITPCLATLLFVTPLFSQGLGDDDKLARVEIAAIAKSPTDQNLVRLIGLISAAPERQPLRMNGTLSKRDFPAVAVLIANGERGLNAFFASPDLDKPQRASTCELYASFLKALQDSLPTKLRLQDALNAARPDTQRRSNLGATLFYYDQPNVLGAGFLSLQGVLPPNRHDDSIPTPAPATSSKPNSNERSEAAGAHLPTSRLLESKSVAKDTEASQPESPSMLVWLLVVIIATAGAVWVFLRKSK